MPEHDEEIDPITPVELTVVFPPGTSQAEVEQTLLLQPGFMAALLTDPRVRGRLSVWLERLKEHAERKEAGAAPPELNAIVTTIVEDGVGFVRDELGLSWSWVWGDLIGTMHGIGNLGITDPVEAAAPSGTAEIIAPPFKIENSPGSGVSMDEARAELLSMLRRLDEIDAAAKATRQTQRPREGGAYLRMWGRWYYEARVRRPRKSQREIAAEYCQAEGHPKHHDCRAYVRRSLKKAEHLLNLGVYTL